MNNLGVLDKEEQKMGKNKIYTIDGKKYLNPYVAICTCCDKTFKTIQEAFDHANKTGEDVYFCQEV